MNKTTCDNWIDAMIERESIPEALRGDTVLKFCKKWGVAESTYYWNARRKENQEKIISTALRNCKKHAPEVLENLAVRAKKNKDDARLYLQFILQLAEKTDITSGGKPIGQILDELNGKPNTKR